MNKDLKSTSFHEFVIGTPGTVSKTITFKESEFDKDLAPKDAEIQRIEVNGENFVRMTYYYGNPKD